MFISQVIFESDIENREEIEAIMLKKREDIERYVQPISSEIWWKEDKKTVAFSLVAKWQSKDDFKTWMKESHKEGHAKRSASAPEIRKTLFQFEPVE